MPLAAPKSSLECQWYAAINCTMSHSVLCTLWVETAVTARRRWKSWTKRSLKCAKRIIFELYLIFFSS